MTVASETNRSGPYSGNGVTTVFAYGFRIVDQSHLQVIRTDATGDETTLALLTDYTVSGVGSAGGGSITLTTALPSGSTVTILRNIPFTQETDLENQGAYYAQTVEDALDLAVMRDQQLAEKLNRAVLVPATETDPTGALASQLAADITRLADSADNIDTVADSIADVNTVADNVADLNTVADNIGAIVAAAGSVLDLVDASFTGDGSETSFILPAAAVSAQNVLVWVGGVRQVPGDDYSVSGTMLTLTAIPGAGVAIDVLVITAVTAQAILDLYGELQKAVNIGRCTVLTTAGQTTYAVSTDGDPLGLTPSNHILIGPAPLGALTYGVDYTVTEAGALVLAFSPREGDLLHLFLTPRTTNDEAQQILNEFQAMVAGDADRAEAAANDVVSAISVFSSSLLSGAFSDRNDAVSAAASLTWPVGSVISDGNVKYKRSGTGSAIPDMPGWVPYGDITARHFSNVVSSGSLNMAADYIRMIGGGTIVTRDEWGQATITSTVDITGVALRGGQFKHGTGDQDMFTASGSVGSLGTLTASAARGDATINLSSTVGVVAGTFILITSTDAYATTDAGYRSGEVVEVASVSGGAVTLVSPVQGRIDRSAYNVGDLVRVVNYAKGPVISDITVEGDWEAKGLILFASYVDKPELHRVYVKDHGNAAIRYHNTKNGKLSGGRIQNLRMDLPNDRSAYAMMLSGSDVGFEMDGVVTDKVRHAFTTIGGSGGFPRKFSVKNCTDFNSLSGSFDTHAAGADYEISNCSSFDSAGNAFQCRAPYGTHHGNTAVRPKVHGFLLAENVLADVTISAFTLRDGGNIGISCAVNCNNLRILDCVLDGMATYGIRLFNSATVASSGAVINRNVIRNWGAVTSGLPGIQIDGSQANTSILIDGNNFNAGIAGATSAIRILSATGCTAKDNAASGSYSSTVFSVGSSNRLLNNVTIGALADAVGAAATDAATTMALVNAIRASLIQAGIVRQ